VAAVDVIRLDSDFVPAEVNTGWLLVGGAGGRCTAGDDWPVQHHLSTDENALQ